MRFQNQKGRLIGGLVGMGTGFGISYIVWGKTMWEWGVPSGVPILLAALIGGLIGHEIADTPTEEERRLTRAISQVMNDGAKGLFVGAGIGALIGGALSFCLWWLASLGAALCVVIAFLGLSTGGLVGFLSAASTSYERPEG